MKQEQELKPAFTIVEQIEIKKSLEKFQKKSLQDAIEDKKYQIKRVNETISRRRKSLRQTQREIRKLEAQYK